MRVGKLHASRWGRCLALDFSGSGQARFALCSQATISDPATLFPEAGGSYTKITCRLSRNGDGWEAACGTTSQRSDVTALRPSSGLSTAELGSVSFMIGAGAATVAPRIRSFLLTITM